jgi:hypothetical protein
MAIIKNEISNGEVKENMSNDTSLINLGDLSKPATVLVEKISDAIGGIFKPYQIRRVAKAESEAETIRAATQIEISEMQRRAFVRFVAEEAKKQANIESITRRALEDVKDDARPQEVEDDWISNFFDKCRLISDEEMQSLWAKVLAGEANFPGKYSKRTVNVLSSIDKSDAALFTQLCGYGWFFGDVISLIYDSKNEIYRKNGINFNSLKHLDSIGLLSFESLAGYKRMGLPELVTILYYGTPIKVKFNNKENNSFKFGQVMLSQIGQQLAPISGSKPVPDFMDYVLSEWAKFGLVTFSDYPKREIKPVRSPDSS